MPRRMRWAVHVARVGRGGVHTGFWWGNPEVLFGRPKAQMG